MVLFVIGILVCLLVWIDVFLCMMACFFFGFFLLLFRSVGCCWGSATIWLFSRVVFVVSEFLDIRGLGGDVRGFV